MTTEFVIAVTLELQGGGYRTLVSDPVTLTTFSVRGLRTETENLAQATDNFIRTISHKGRPIGVNYVSTESWPR